MKYFGDSYDVVKQSLIRWLGEFGRWSVHPMLTESTSALQARAFERFLGAQIICTEVLSANTDRDSYFSCGTRCGNLFLDPDIGLRLERTGQRSSKAKYLYGEEFAHLSEARPQALTLVFDQSLPRGGEAVSMKGKLEDLRAAGTHCFAYMSHACFIVGGRDATLVRQALRQVITESRLPETRFLS